MPPQFIHIRLSNVDLPTLDQDHIDKLSAPFLDFLRQKGEVESYGDFQLISFKDDHYDSIITKSVELYTTGQLQNGAIQVCGPAGNLEMYREAIHKQDTKFTTTQETHKLFLEHVDLYLSSLDLDIEDLRAHLCQTICTVLPVYEAEIVVMLNRLHEKPSRLHNADAGLFKLLCERIGLFYDTLVMNESVVSLLRDVTNHKALLSYISPTIHEAAIDHVLANYQLKPSIEAAKLLDFFVAKYSSSAAPARQTIPVRSSQHSPSISSAQTSQQRQQGGVGQPNDDMNHYGNNSSSTPANGPSAHTTVPSNDAPSRKRQAPDSNRPAPDTRTRSPFLAGGIASSNVTVSRPEVEGKYYSVRPDKWEKFDMDKKRRYMHANHICETDAGMFAPERCSECIKRDTECQVYTSHPKNSKQTPTCAKCRLRDGTGCSHNAYKKTRTDGHDSGRST